MASLLTGFNESRVVLGGVSRTTLYDLVHKGDLELVKIGRRSFITTQSLERYVAGLVAAREDAS